MSDGPQPRRVLANRYVLRGLLGQGGMADVELAYDQVLDRQVAVKMLHQRYADDESFLARFRREAQAAASLNHPNVVAVYDTGDEGGRPFIVMEYVPGRSLREVLRREGVTPRRAAAIGIEAALALGFAHDRGLVHRDIKPAQHHGRRRGPGEGRRLRHRARGERRERHADSRRVRDRGLRRAGAGAGPARRRPHRHLRAGLLPVRDAHGTAALLRRFRGRPGLQARVGAPGPAQPAQPRGAASARGGRPHGHGQGPGCALPDRTRAGRRPPARRRGSAGHGAYRRCCLRGHPGADAHGHDRGLRRDAGLGAAGAARRPGAGRLSRVHPRGSGPHRRLCVPRAPHSCSARGRGVPLHGPARRRRHADRGPGRSPQCRATSPSRRRRRA